MLTVSRNIRIEWGDCDPAGIVYYPRYFEMFDAATSALFERATGMTKLAALRAYDFAGHPLVATRGRFLKPLRFGDDVVCETTATEVKRSSVQILHKITKDGEVSVEGYETRVWVGWDPANPKMLKARPFPPDVAARLSG
jgi:4-hydroxybenzoyl-CoA thioesterase